VRVILDPLDFWPRRAAIINDWAAVCVGQFQWRTGTDQTQVESVAIHLSLYG
jgi:hypothetical protein